MTNYNDLKIRVDALDKESNGLHDLLQRICNELKDRVKHYDWVGFYFKNGEKEELRLHEFAGKPTEHVRIPFGKGICGQVAVSNANFVVQDVSEQDNYIACSIDVRSEIVIPVFVEGRNVGQIDIDSHLTEPFTKEDEWLLEYVCQLVAKRIEKLPEGGMAAYEDNIIWWG